MKKNKYLFVFVVVGLLLGACSKDSNDVLDEYITNSPDYGLYSIKVEFDDQGFDPDWLIDFSGSALQYEDEFGIEGLSVISEVEKSSNNKNSYLFLFSSDDNKSEKTYNIKLKKKSLGINLIMTINEVEDIFPSGKVKVYKNGKQVNSFDIGTLTMVFHPSSD